MREKKISVHWSASLSEVVTELRTDFASLYQVEPRSLIQAVKWNIMRAPAVFVFCLERQEVNQNSVLCNPQTDAWKIARVKVRRLVWKVLAMKKKG